MNLPNFSAVVSADFLDLTKMSVCPEFSSESVTKSSKESIPDTSKPSSSIMESDVTTNFLSGTGLKSLVTSIEFNHLAISFTFFTVADIAMN